MSGNPSPQHVPTDGLGVAAYVQVSGSSGSSVIGPVGTEMSGQGHGASASGTKPVAQYAVTLSVSAAGGYVTTLSALAKVVDAQNNDYDPSDLDQFVAHSYNNPNAGTPAWYNPKAQAGYSADVASVTAAGISGSTSSLSITALNPGQAVIEVAFATFDNTLGNTAQPPADLPANKIFALVLVNVIP